jgi:spermidine synthase
MINVYKEIDRRLQEDGFYCEQNNDIWLSPYGYADEHIEDAIGRYMTEMMIENTIVSETLFENCSYEVGYVAVSYLDENGRPNLDTWTYEVM